MSYTSAEVKLRTLAIADPNVSAAVGTRWFDRRLLPGYINQGTCVRAFRVSTIRTYSQAGLQNLSQPRFQIDVLDFDADTARSVAATIIDFLGTISLAQNNQFNSPYSTPPQFPTFLLGQRAGMEAQVDASGNPLASKGPIFIESLDIRLYNLEN